MNKKWNVCATKAYSVAVIVLLQTFVWNIYSTFFCSYLQTHLSQKKKSVSA